MNQNPLRTVRLPGSARRSTLLIGTLAASALALTACGGGDDDGAQPSTSPTPETSTSAAPAEPSTSSPAPSSTGTSASPSGPASPSASPTGSAALSLDMPEELSGERLTALRQVVQLAAGPGAELGQHLASPLERHASLQGDAEVLEDLVTQGEPDGAELDERQQTCLDAARDAMRSEADAGAAQVTWYAQPATAGTTDGSAASTGTKDDVEPLGVQVAVYPDEASAAAGLESSRDASEACEGTVLTGVGVVRLEPLTWPDGQGFTLLPDPEASVYAVATAVQAGDRVFTVRQADADGGVPDGAEDRARQLIEDLEAALEG